MATRARKRAVSERFIADQVKITDRSCGECSLCCKLMGVPELKKPANTWCPHCRPGAGGCIVYTSRPATCRGFACEWLVNPDIGPSWYPLLCHMVIVFTGSAFTVVVDPDYPDSWRAAPYRQGIAALAKSYPTTVRV